MKNTDTTSNRQVNAKEIERLYRFTRQHYVEYYDLQTELVDHLANAIEDRWHTHPELDFEENLQLEFKKFGVFGFSDIVKGRRKAVEKRYWKILGRESMRQIIKPKVFGSLLVLYFGSFLLCKSETGYYWMIGILFVISLAVLIYSFRRRKKQEKNKSERIYLLESILIQAEGGTGVLFILFPTNLNNIFGNSTPYEPSLYLSFLIPFFATLPFFLFYMTTYILPKKRTELLEEFYPERKFMHS